MAKIVPLCICSLIMFWYGTTAAVSFSSVGSWFSSWHDAHEYKEIPFTTAGNVTITNIDGPVVVKTWSLPKVVVEAKKSTKEKDLEHIAIETEVSTNYATISTLYKEKNISGNVNYTLMVPEHTNVTIQTGNGSIKIRKVHGAIAAKTEHGDIEIEHATRSITAHTDSGSIAVTYAKVPLNANTKITNTSGHISLTLPKNTQARITAQTEKGTVTSEQPITLAPQTTKLGKEFWNRIKKDITGILGNGGGLIALQTNSGNIKLLSGHP